MILNTTYSSEGPKCPYCGRQFTADDSLYYDAYNYTKDICDECGKTFIVEVCTTIEWICEEIEDER